VFGHWLALLGSVVMVLLRLFERIRRQVPVWVWHTLIVGFVVVAVFQAWRDEHRAVATVVHEHESVAQANESLRASGEEKERRISALELQLHQQPLRVQVESACSTD
jgi:hypothetical protein